MDQPYISLNGLQALTDWKLQTDSSVTPNPASNFTFVSGGVLFQPTTALVSITGQLGKYTGGMASKNFSLPISPITGQPITSASLRITFQLDDATSMQAIEFGAKITDANGITYNPNFQLDNSESANATTLTIVNSQYTWSVFNGGGGVLPRLTTLTDHTVICNYSWAHGTVSVTSFVVDGQTYPVPASQQNLAGQSLGWEKSIITLCVQPDVNTLGGTYHLLLKDISITGK